MTDLVNECEGRKTKREKEEEWKEERKNERDGARIHMCMRESVSKGRVPEIFCNYFDCL